MSIEKENAWIISNYKNIIIVTTGLVMQYGLKYIYKLEILRNNELYLFNKQGLHRKCYGHLLPRL